MELIDCYTLPKKEDTRTAYRLLPRNLREAYYRERIDRNIGWITEDEQDTLRRSVVGIAGCGGMGGLVASILLRAGVGEIRIADCEVFDVSNINRQFGAKRSTVGKSKAFTTARELRDITDDSTIIVYPQGISEETVDDFLDGCDIVCDEIEFWAVGARILLHERAREKGLSVFNCNTIGFGTRFYHFTPSSTTMEELLGMSYAQAKEIQERVQKKKATEDEISFVMGRVLEGLVPEIPNYTRDELPCSNEIAVRARLFMEGKAPIIATNPPMASGFLSDQILLHLLRSSDIQREHIRPPEMPSYLYFDAAMLQTKVVTDRWWRHVRGCPVPGGYTIRPVADDRMDAIYQLRYVIFCDELAFLDGKHYPDGRERDEFDDDADHIEIMRDDKLVAYTRFIRHDPKRQFPIEQEVTLNHHFPRESAVEVSRGIVVPDERGGDAIDYLVQGIYEYCRNTGVTHLLSFSNERMCRYWRKRGTKFHYVGDPVTHHGYKTWPLIIDIQ
jgi:molybdopterin/thiamine biosynthesis adenylyltransferase/N-acyl-L-homoserine lactone synthetase